MFGAIWRWIKRICKNYSDTLGAAIDYGNVREIAFYVIAGIITFVGVCAVVALITLLIAINAEFIFAWIVLPILVIWGVLYWISTAKTVEVADEVPDPIEDELVMQRANEVHPDVRGTVFISSQAAANNTPITRPLDEYEIETASVSRNSIYLTKDRIPVHQFELGLERPIDRATEDLIHRELQNNITKQAKRFPMLISSEAQGRAPVEVLDVKNLGMRVLIEVCLTTTASIPMIEARRRARVERQQRSADTFDRDF